MSTQNQTHAFAPVRNTKLWYSDTGGDGQVVLLCHPASQGIEIWQSLRSALSAAEFRVVAYCRRGYGYSERGPAHDPSSTIVDLLELCDFLGIERFHLVGAAAGGMTALGFAVEYEPRLYSLTLAGTIFAPNETDWHEMYQRLGIQAVRANLPLEFLELGPTYRASDPQGVDTFLRLHREAVPQTPIQQPLGVEVSWPALERLSLPVLLLTGEADLYAPPPLQALVGAHLRNARAFTIRGCGHAPYWETPDEFQRLLLDFLNSV